MEQISRSLIANSERLNRPHQAVARPNDWNGQLAQIRNIARTNVSEDGGLKTNIGKKIKDDVFTLRVAYSSPSFRGHRYIRLILSGIEAEEAVRDQLKPGDWIKFDGITDGKVDDDGRLIRMPRVFASFYEKVQYPGKEQGTAPEQVSSSGIEQI